MIDTLYHKKSFKRCRESTWDRSGGGYDLVTIGPGESATVPALTGPGIVKHIWLAIGTFQFGDAYRAIRLVMRFDGEAQPQVDVPLADFFLFGHGLLVDVDSIPIQVTRTHHILEPPYQGALNCTFPMPFARSAEISLVNTSDAERPFHVHYYVDWEQHSQLEEPPSVLT